MKIPEYTLSLLFFVLPIIVITAFLHGRKLLRQSQKKALWINIAALALIGFFLDLVFADAFFVFPDPSQTMGIFIRGIPIEEFLFYASGFWFIVLLYVFGDEYFLKRYNVDDATYSRYAGRLRKRLYLSVSPKLFATLATIILALVGLKRFLNPGGSLLPGYIVFLLLAAYAPYVLFWRVTRRFVNFQALFVTIALTTLISVIWEVTLALPRGYWGYRSETMLGVFLPAWHSLPIEAVTVWIFCSLIVLSYEFTKIAFFGKKARKEART